MLNLREELLHGAHERQNRPAEIAILAPGRLIYNGVAGQPPVIKQEIDEA